MRRKAFIFLSTLISFALLFYAVSCQSDEDKTKDTLSGDAIPNDTAASDITGSDSPISPDASDDVNTGDTGGDTSSVTDTGTEDTGGDAGANNDTGSTADVGFESRIEWQDGPSTLDKHAEGIAAFAGGKIYLLAIFGTSKYKREVLDISEGKWNPLADLPEGFNNDMSMRAGGVIGKSIHIVNGHYWFTPYTDHYVFNTETQEWSKKEPYPGDAVGKSCAAIYDGKLYVAGGEKAINSNTAVSRFYRYDPATGEWTELAPMKQPRADFACAFVNGKFHVAGGYQESKKPLASHEIYDTEKNEWRDAEPMPVAAYEIGNAGIEFDGKFVIIGGKDGADLYLDKTMAYDQTTNMWTYYDSIKNPRASHSVVNVGGTIYVIGGFGYYMYTDSVEIGSLKAGK